MPLGTVGTAESRQATGHRKAQQTTSSGGCQSSTKHVAMRNWKQQDGGDPGNGQHQENLEADYQGKSKA